MSDPYGREVSGESLASAGRSAPRAIPDEAIRSSTAPVLRVRTREHAIACARQDCPEAPISKQGPEKVCRASDDVGTLFAP